jgi:hypothetical protein
VIKPIMSTSSSIGGMIIQRKIINPNPNEPTIHEQNLRPDSIERAIRSPVMSIGDLQSAAYVTILIMRGEEVGADEAQMVRRISKAMEAHRKMTFMRGNGKRDYEKTEGLNFIFYVAVESYARLAKDHPECAARFLESPSGTCSSHADVIAHIVAGILRRDERITVIAQMHKQDQSPEHCYVVLETVVDGAVKRYIINPWVKGGPVRDSDFVYRETKIPAYERYSYDQKTGAEACEKMFLEHRRIEQDHRVQADLDGRVISEAARAESDPSDGEMFSQWKDESAYSPKFRFGLEREPKHPSPEKQVARKAAVAIMGFSLDDAKWFANCNDSAEYALLHEKFPDYCSTFPAREGAARVGPIETRVEDGRMVRLDPWSSSEEATKKVVVKERQARDSFMAAMESASGLSRPEKALRYTSLANGHLPKLFHDECHNALIGELSKLREFNENEISSIARLFPLYDALLTTASSESSEKLVSTFHALADEAEKFRHTPRFQYVALARHIPIGDHEVRSAGRVIDGADRIDDLDDRAGVYCEIFEHSSNVEVKAKLQPLAKNLLLEVSRRGGVVYAQQQKLRRLLDLQCATL